MKIENRLFENLGKGKMSVGAVVTMSDLTVSELAEAAVAACRYPKTGKILGTAAGGFPRWKVRGVDWFAGGSDWGAMAAGFRQFKADCEKASGE